MGISLVTGGKIKQTKKTAPKCDDIYPKLLVKTAEEVPGMNGAVEVPRKLLPPELTNVAVFEFGNVEATADKVTLIGYCPVSDELEPCRWEILPATSSIAPQFRVAF